MEEKLVQLSRTMSYALRHHPESFGLTLDSEGWTPVDDLLAALREQQNTWRNVSIDDLSAVIKQSEKRRFEISDNRIRAYYGHSISEKVTKEMAVPPPVLFHGTTPEAANHIELEGLKPMKRQYVHLSADRETALQVARRRTRLPIILCISALEAHQQGVHFYLGNDMVWLADTIPPKFITADC